MNFKEIVRSIKPDIKEIEATENLPLSAIGKYSLIKAMNVLLILIVFGGVIYILHYFGVEVKFK